MKRLFICIAVISASVFCFSSCSKDADAINSPHSRTSDLRIETEISSTETGVRALKSALNSFPEGSAISLFVTNSALGTHNNAKAEYKSSKWEITPAVKLGDSPATVYAFYPYNTSYTTGASDIEINHTNQVDNMYGTHAEGQDNINRNNPNVRLRMKHAKVLLQFRIRKMNYMGEGKLTAIEVLNKAGLQDLRSSYTLNVYTGKMTASNHFSPASIVNPDGLYMITDKEPTEEKDIMDVMVLPVVKTNSHGSIMIRFTIDGEIFTYNVPYDTKWDQGTKYVYNVTLNGTGLVIDDIIISDWTEGAKGEINLY